MACTRRALLIAFCIPLTIALAAFFSCRAADPAPAPATQTDRLLPADLVYRGAFRLPDEPPDIGWGWSGQALAYYPDGDPKGDDDGFPGSLFGTGHDWHQFISEISIPKPVVSAAKKLADLNTARTLQKFQDVRAGKFPEMEQPRAGLAFLPKQGRQTSAKLYFCFGPHMDETNTDPSHAWCDLDLANPRTAGPWRIAGLPRYLTCHYLLPIPADWADKHTPGLLLATGRFRDGGQGSQGPALFAYGPWNEGNPPDAGATLKAVTLLRYSSVNDDPQYKLKDYHHSDEWSGGAWLSAGNKAAVVFVGTKGTGKCWYGFANGVVWPEEGPWPPVPDAPNDQRGWWSTAFVAQMIFYDPADLAAVVAAKKKPHEPQPYATLDISKLLYRQKPRLEFHHVGALAFDRARGLLYLMEPRGDEDKSLVHVWQISPPPAVHP